VSHDEYKQRGWPLAIERLKPGGGLVVDVKAEKSADPQIQ
jgi:hypothetical protein